MIFTEGAVYSSHSASAEKVAETGLKIDWDVTILAGSDERELVSFVFYNEISNQAMMFNSEVQRSAGTITIEMPAIR